MKSFCFISLSVYGYFNPSVPPSGGAQRQLSLLSRELSYEFEVCFVVGDYGQPKHEIRDGIEFYRAYHPSTETRSYEQPIQFWKLRKAMARAGANAYIFRGHPWKAAFTYLLAASLGKPWIYNIANDANIEQQPAALPTPVRWLFKRALSNAAAVIAQTPKQNQRLEEKYGVEAATVPNGYPAAKNVQSHENRDHFLWVGRLDEEQKQPHYYLDLAGRFPSETFLLAGPGGHSDSYNSHIRERASQLENVVNVGTVPPDEIHDLYRDAIALVNTSAYEGFPNTFLEAWRYGTSVLALAVDPERFLGSEHGVTGYAEGEFETLVSMTQELADSTKKRRELGVIGMETFEQRYHLETVVNSYRKLLEETISDE